MIKCNQLPSEVAKDGSFVFNSLGRRFLAKKIIEEKKDNGDSHKSLPEFLDGPLDQISHRLLVHMHDRRYFLQTELIKKAKPDCLLLPWRELSHRYPEFLDLFKLVFLGDMLRFEGIDLRNLRRFIIRGNARKALFGVHHPIQLSAQRSEKVVFDGSGIGKGIPAFPQIDKKILNRFLDQPGIVNNMKAVVVQNANISLINCFKRRFIAISEPGPKFIVGLFRIRYVAVLFH